MAAMKYYIVNSKHSDNVSETTTWRCHAIKSDKSYKELCRIYSSVERISEEVFLVLMWINNIEAPLPEVNSILLKEEVTHWYF